MKYFSIFLLIACILTALQFSDLPARTEHHGIGRINPKTLYETSAYTQVTTVPPGMALVYVSGQTDRVLHPEGINSEENSTACSATDMLGQYKVTMDNVGKGLKAAGASWDDVVSIRKFTTDMDAFLQASHSMPAFWSNGSAPSSTLIGVASLADPCFMVEIDVVAAIQSAP
jgi:enamine deaminase RidA (YjgF/YER057c/UK114 family)